MWNRSGTQPLKDLFSDFLDSKTPDHFIFRSETTATLLSWKQKLLTARHDYISAYSFLTLPPICASLSNLDEKKVATSFGNVTSTFRNHFLIILNRLASKMCSNYPVIKLVCVVWRPEKIENLSPGVLVVHTNAKLDRTTTAAKCTILTCKAWKTTVFHS